MSLEAITQEVNELLEDARVDFLEQLKSDEKWEWPFTKYSEETDIWFTSKDHKYSVHLSEDGELSVFFARYELISEKAPPKVNPIIAFFTKYQKPEQTPLAKRVREIDAVLTAEHKLKVMQTQLLNAKERFSA